MRIKILSDLHFEFHADNGLSFIKSLDNKNIDVLVLAGDIATWNTAQFCIDMLCEHFSNSTVLYVLGNHEYYKTSREHVWNKVIPKLKYYKM